MEMMVLKIRRWFYRSSSAKIRPGGAIQDPMTSTAIKPALVQAEARRFILIVLA
jgi:hypothetical protein